MFRSVSREQLQHSCTDITDCRAALRRRLSPPGPVANSGAVFHGNHMMVGMALGFLFLSGGMRSFGSSKASTAALVISLFPRFPVAPTDNRWHLQVCFEDGIKGSDLVFVYDRVWSSCSSAGACAASARPRRLLPPWSSVCSRASLWPQQTTAGTCRCASGMTVRALTVAFLCNLEVLPPAEACAASARPRRLLLRWSSACSPASLWLQQTTAGTYRYAQAHEGHCCE